VNPDPILTVLDRALASLAGTAKAKRLNPAAGFDATLSAEERRHCAGLMRVNHCGEICAQALYEGQAAAARSTELRASLIAAARDERDHLAWCRERLGELDDRPSRLDPLFYAASYALGAATALLGDRISLGFVRATEEQVRRHLDSHLERLPPGDAKSRAILTEMRTDETRHGADAAHAGGVDLPAAVKGAMRLAATVMTRTTYWI